jgi:heat shock protein HslJ
MKTPARLLTILVLASLTLVACSASDLTREAHPTTLAGTNWRVVTINGMAPNAGKEPTMVFAGAQVSGSAGCNSYSGAYRYEPSTGAIAFDQTAMTAMACVDRGQMDVEVLFSNAMTGAASASLDPEGRLVLLGPAGEIVLVVDAVGS